MGEFEEAAKASGERLGRVVHVSVTTNDDSSLRSFGRDALEINWPQLKKLLPTLAREYIDKLEMDETVNVCSCEWIIHPDDVEKPEGERRLRPGMQDPNCPRHTKQGFILGFFKWVMTGAIVGD